MARRRAGLVAGLLAALLIIVPGASVNHVRPEAAPSTATALATVPLGPDATNSPAGPEPPAAAPAAPVAFEAEEELLAGESVIAPPPEVFDGPPPVPEAPPEPLRHDLAGVERQGGIWAVVIGINDYPGTRSDLRSAVKDADDMERALLRLGVGQERTLVLRDRQATAGVIRSSARWLVANAAPDATVVFFYAGHVRRLSPSTHAIVAADGGLVRDHELADDLRDLAAQRAWIVMAACYGAGFDEVLAPGRVLTAAAGPDDLAYENSAYNRSYLGEYLVRRGLLEGRAEPTVQGAFAYARSELARDYPNRMVHQIDRAPGPVSLVPNGPTPATSPPPPPPPPPPPTDSDGSDTGGPTDGDDDRKCTLRAGPLTSCRRT